jgi:hypothetical protein
MRNGGYEDAVDVMLLPAVEPGVIRDGVRPSAESPRSPYPPQYAGGVGAEGGEHLREWIRKGGTVVALDSSSGYLIELLDLPVRNVLEEVPRESFYCPGSMLRIDVDTDHPLGFGLRAREAAYFANSPAFQTRVPDPRFARRVIARYPEDDQDILVSGYLKGGERLEKRAAVVELEVGDGKVILIGFRAQHRAQPHRTFKLLFNALYRHHLEEADL